jgi:molybdopterin-guanine dinucleotide biosynthesis protein A
VRSASLVIFAGGRATRLGGLRKAQLRVGGRTILERVLDALGPLVNERLALVDTPDPQNTVPGLQLVVDEQPYEGPLPALAHGLQVAQGDVCLLVASDMPFVSRDAFAYLLRAQSEESADVVVPYVDAHLEPMHSVVERRALAIALDHARASGERRLFRVLQSLNPRLVDADELRQVDPDLRTLFNVNTPADLAEAERLLAAHH